MYRSIKEYNDNDNTETIIYLLPFETENYIISSNDNKYIVTFRKDGKGQTVVADNNKKIKENFTDDLKSAIKFEEYQMLDARIKDVVFPDVLCPTKENIGISEIALASRSRCAIGATAPIANANSMCPLP